MQVSFTPAEIAAIVQPRESRGSTNETIHGVSALGPATPGDLTFLANLKYKSEVKETLASIVLLPHGFDGDPRPDQLFLLVE